MRTKKIENGIEITICDNLGEFLEEFKKYRTKKSNIASKENYSKHVFAMTSHKHNSKEMKTFGLHLILEQNPRKKEMLFFDLSTINLKDNKWLSCEKKIEKILKEIWVKGSTETKYSDLKSLLENKDKPEQISPTKPSDKKDKIIWWIGGGTIFILFASFLVYLFRKESKGSK